MKEYLKHINRYTNNVDRNQYDLFLGQNERNYSLPIFSEFLKTLKESDIFFYPDYSILKKKLSNFYNIAETSFIITPGSDYGIKMVFEITDFGDKGSVLSTSFCFPMYKVYCDIFNVQFKQVDYNGVKIDVNDIINSIDINTKLVFLANPNSPLGDYITRQDIIKILKKGVHVIVDEAYIETTDRESSIELVNYYNNLTVLRTFSKAFGAAGLRVGTLFSNSENIQNYYSKVKLMYEVNSIGAKYIEFILDNKDYFTEYIEQLKESKRQFVTKLKGKLEYIDTEAGWVFIKRYQFDRDLLSEFEDKKIHTRTLILPSQECEWIKLNYDLKLDNYDFNFS